MTRRVVVTYGLGSASPGTIAEAATGACDLVWQCDLADPHCRVMIPILRRLGTVVTCEPGASFDDRARAISALRPAGITTFCDARVRETAELASRLGLLFHELPAAAKITNKYTQRQALRSAGLQDLRYRLVTSHGALAGAARDLKTAVIVKPVHGEGSRHTFRIARAADLDAVLAGVSAAEMAEGYIVEEELAGSPGALGAGIGDYVSVETVTLRGEHQVAGIVGRLALAHPFRERGGFYPSTLNRDLAESVSRLAVDALTALGVSAGVSHTEVKLTPQGAEILEVNGRLGGHVAWLIRRNGGPDLVRAALLASVGQRTDLGTHTPAGVAFRHVPPAPVRVGIATAVQGVREVRALPYVESVEMRVRRGTRVDWREGTGSCLAEISGWARTHRQMVRCTSRIEELLQVSLAEQPSPVPGSADSADSSDSR